MDMKRFQKRFGTVAVQKGFITKEQLAEALEIQIKEETEAGKHRLVGTILFERGFLTLPQIYEVFEAMRKRTDFGPGNGIPYRDPSKLKSDKEDDES